MKPRDLLAILQAGRWVFIAVFSLTIIAATVALLALPATYEAHAVLELGRVAGRAVEEPRRLLRHLHNEYGRNLRVKDKQLSAGILQLYARGSTAEESRDALKRIVGELLAQHDAISNYYLNQYRTALSQMDSHMKALEAQLVTIADTQSRSLDPNWIVTESRVREALSEITETRLKTEITWGLNIHPTRILQPVQSLEELFPPGTLIRPRPKHYIVAILVAFVLSGLAAFLAGYVSWLAERAKE